MYIFGYLFEKEYFEGSLKKGHTDRKFWGGRRLPCKPEGLNISSAIYFFTTPLNSIS